MRANRRQQILELIAENGQITVAQIVARFTVSEMTARRDLAELAREGLLRRVHGGAMSNRGRSYEPPYPLRTNKNLTAKQMIGKTAAAMIDDGDSIAFDVGTTTLEIARCLNGKYNLTVVTASLPIANEVIRQFSLESDLRLLLTGGTVRSGEHSMIGEFASRMYRELHVDKAFVGVGGVSLEAGLTEYNLDDTLVKRAMITAAGQVIVVADSSKFGRTTFAHIAALSDVDVIVTDRGVDRQMVTALRDMAIDVIIADEV